MSESNLPAKNGRDIRGFLEANLEAVKRVCEKTVSPEKIVQVAAIVAYRTPELAQCDPASVLASVIQAASLGLDLHPSSGEAYLVPYRGVCTFQTGYQGLCKLARQAGTHYIAARLVYEADEFTWEFSPELIMRHVPCRDGAPGKLLGAYAVARVESGELVGEYMSLMEIEYIRSKSKMPNGFGWKDHYGEMAKKTPCRRLCKWLPKSSKLVEALASIDQDYQPDPGPDGSPESIPGETKVEKLTAVVAARAAQITVNGNGNGSSPPPKAPESTPEVKASPVASAPGVATTLAVAEPIAPRTGLDLEQHALADGTLAWFQAFGRDHGFPGKGLKLNLWSPTQVKLAWNAYESEGMEAS